MEVKSEIKNGIFIIYISGVINTAKAQELKNEIINSIPSDMANIIMDFTKVEYISSYMIGIIMDLINKTKKLEGRFIITNINETVEQILKITGIYDRLSSYDTIENAIASISK